MIQRLANWHGRQLSSITGQPVSLIFRDRIEHYAYLPVSVVTHIGDTVRTHYGEFLNAMEEQGYDADVIVECMNNPTSFSHEWNTWVETAGMNEDFPTGMIEPAEHGYVECEACGEWHKRDENAELIDRHFCDACSE